MRTTFSCSFSQYCSSPRWTEFRAPRTASGIQSRGSSPPRTCRSRMPALCPWPCRATIWATSRLFCVSCRLSKVMLWTCISESAKYICSKHFLRCLSVFLLTSLRWVMIACILIAYVLLSIGDGESWRRKLTLLMADFPTIEGISPEKDMGFPAEWGELDIWNVEKRE